MRSACSHNVAPNSSDSRAEPVVSLRLVTFDVRATANREEFDDAFLAIGQYFGSPRLTDERFARFQRVLPFDRMHAAFEDGTIVGGAGAFTFELSVPGGVVPCAGVSVVGVFPSHRRRGVLRSMMRAQLEDIHERGEPLAALWASEETIYGRYGYGISSWCGDVSVPREYTAFARPFEHSGRMRIVEPDEALQHLPHVLERVMEQRPGVYRRSDAWWRDREIADPEDRREGAGPKRFALCEREGEVTGYAIYRHKMEWADGVAAGKVIVIEALASDDESTRELWHFLLNIDWIATIEAGLLPPDHPLFLLLASPRRARYRVFDGLWVRVVDVGAALSARSYGPHEAIVLELADPFCPWNEGRWKLEGGAAARTDDEPDLRLDAEALGSAYLGGVSFVQLAAAGRAEELRPGELARADAAFRSAVHPWCPEIF
jgi:predicted acetyltransferase